MAAAAQRDCAERDPRGGRLRSRHNLRIGLWGALQSVSPSLGVELRPVDVRAAGEIERALAAFARPKNGGLIATGSADGPATLRSLAKRNKMCTKGHTSGASNSWTNKPQFENEISGRPPSEN